MKKDLSEVHRIERLTQQYFNNGDLRKGLKTYRTLLEAFPRDRSYYVNYINFLLDESVIAELLWPAYQEAVACCDRAISQVSEEDKEYFYVKKAELYLIMIDGDPAWFREHEMEVSSFFELGLEKYTDSTGLLKCAVAFYRVTSNTSKYEEVLDKSLLYSPNDIMFVLQKVHLLEKQTNIDAAISIIEDWIKNNPNSSYLKAAYPKIINLYKTNENAEMADTYQDLLDNL